MSESVNMHLFDYAYLSFCRVPGELIPDLSSIVFGEKQVFL